MPMNQTAATGLYGFGAPATLAEVLRFSVRRGANLNLRWENLGRDKEDGDLSVQVKVSSDNVTFTDTTAADHITDFAPALVLGAREHLDTPLRLRDGKDKFIQILVSGGVQGNVQINGDEHLQIITI